MISVSIQAMARTEIPRTLELHTKSKLIFLIYKDPALGVNTYVTVSSRSCRLRRNKCVKIYR